MAWLPLESNPDVMNKFLTNLGMSTEKWQVSDVYGLDPDVLAIVPRPVLALIMLFPCSDKYEEYKKEQEEEITKKGQTVPGNLFFVKQYVHNACGTIALIHSIANNLDSIKLGDGHLKKYLDDAVKLSPDERGHLLQNEVGIIDTHKELAQEGQTAAPQPTDPVAYHFVAFVHHDGSLFELDGRKSFPINHGSTTSDTLLEDAVKVVKQYIERDPDTLQFTLVALAAANA
ncbi:ubiquitin carboxyl-terminal hydrolase isozyme L3 [Nilaparvata lugens]|uniref:ubiquitin carboxyl-terminal hydrolase isozyme L3 n=1 Tax=Nilaparvata lugens TaxID=108931 RepID=UPI000B991913|nr:ubiquitin carboxyl-terminal hydrolase isozyme L3 [Nilaparvata lugens]